MGFWGKLGRGLLKAAPIAAGFIPGVGGLVGGAVGAAVSKGKGKKILDAMGAAAPILGGMASGRAAGRQAEAEQGQADDRIRAQLAQLGAQRAQFEQESPRTRAQQAAFGDFLGSYKSLGGRSQGEGFGPSAQAAGAKLAQIALAQQGKDTFAVPELSKRPQANALDQILGVAAPAASFLESLPRRGAPPPVQGLSPNLMPPPEELDPEMLPKFPGDEKPYTPGLPKPRFKVRF